MFEELANFTHSNASLPLKSFIRSYRSDALATFQLSYPIVIGQLGVVLMGVIDNVMVGPLGAAALGATGIANSIYFVIGIIGLGTLSAVAPMIAAAKGAGDLYTCKRLLYSSLWISVGLGLLLAVVIEILVWYFDIFGQTPEITALAKEFLFIIGLSIVPMMVFMAVKQFGDGLSHTRVAMCITLAGLFLNTLFNWLLIYGHWGFPALGVRGSALSTMMARLGMAGLILIYVFRSSLFRPYLIAVPGPAQARHLVGKIIRLGLPSGFQYFFEVAAFSAAIVIVGWLGKYPLAAHEIAISLASVTYMMASGIAAAGSIRVGQAVGKGNREGVVRAGTVALVLTGLFMAGCCLIFLTLDQTLVALYITDARVASIATSLVIIAGFFQLSDGIQVVGLGILRGIADVNVPTLVTLFAYWIIGLPLGYWLAFHLGMNVQGIWIGLLMGLTTSAILLTVRFYRLTAVVKNLFASTEKTVSR